MHILCFKAHGFALACWQSLRPQDQTTCVFPIPYNSSNIQYVIARVLFSTAGTLDQVASERKTQHPGTGKVLPLSAQELVGIVDARNIDGVLYVLHFDSLRWKWKMAPWKTSMLVSQSQSVSVLTLVVVALDSYIVPFLFRSLYIDM